MTDGGCRLRRGRLAGWEAVTLESPALRVTVLPAKGADVVELSHRESGTNVLFEAPWGLQPPGSPPREGSGELEFLANYEGGWQELFPSAGNPCSYRGEPIPFHGEVAGLPWDCVIVEETEESVAVRVSVRCRRTPFRLERTMRLEAGSEALVVDEAATNESDGPAHVVWGQHCVLGPPFLAAGCRLSVSARTIVTIPELWEETARLAPGQRSAWPHARLRAGGTVDLSHVPGSEARSHDDVYLTDLEGGWAEVENPALGLLFRLEFDAELFRWLVLWQPYGGAEAMPLRGSYALGIEPWVSRLPLEQAVEAGEAIELAPRETLSTRISASVSTATKEER